MGQRCRSVSVSHFPLVSASVAPGVFVLPVAHDVFPPCDDTEAAAAQRLSLDDFEDEMRVRLAPLSALASLTLLQNNMLTLLHSLATFLSAFGTERNQ